MNSVNSVNSVNFEKNRLIIFVRFLDPDPRQLAEELKESTSKRYKKLNKALAQLVSCHIIYLTNKSHLHKKQYNYVNCWFSSIFFRKLLFLSKNLFLQSCKEKNEAYSVETCSQNLLFLDF